MTPQPGSAQRAFLGWRATASALLPIWALIPLLTESLVQEGDGFQDLAFVLLSLLIYCAAVLVVIPGLAFTLGRWLDRRTAPRGLRRSAISFGLVGFGFGLVLVLLLGLGALTGLGALVVLLAPTVAAVAGRLIVELKGTSWLVIIWGAFALAVMAAIAIIMTLALSARA